MLKHQGVRISHEHHLSMKIESQGWTSLNKNPSWSWSFLAPIVLPELELELLGSTIYYQSWSWSFWALNFFIELELQLQAFLPERELELRVLDKKFLAKSGAA